MTDFYYNLGRFMVICFGPLTLLTIVLMFVSLYRETGRPPHLAGIVFTYARRSIARKGHVGVLTYLLIVSGIFFAVSALGLFVMDVFFK